MMASQSSMTLTISIKVEDSENPEQTIRIEHEYLLHKVSHSSDVEGYRAAWIESSPEVLSKLAHGSFKAIEGLSSSTLKSVDESYVVTFTKFK